MVEARETLENALDELERVLVSLSVSARDSVVVSIKEDPRIKGRVRELVLQGLEARQAAHEAASWALNANSYDDDEGRKAALREVAVVAAAAAHVALEDEKKTEKTEFSVEKIEAAADRVLRAELVVARRFASARQSLHDAARTEMRDAARDVCDALLDRAPPDSFLESRPPVWDALISGDPKEIEAAFQVLLAPVVLYSRHYINVAQLVPRVLLVVAGVIVLSTARFRSNCKHVISVHGYPFLPLSGWLAACVFCDVFVVAFRVRRCVTTQPLVDAFGRGEGAEAADVRAASRAKLVSTYVKHLLAKKPASKKRGAEEDDPDPPHFVDALIPGIEAATERGERALLTLSLLEDSWTTAPLSVLTIVTYGLGLAGGIYMLLPLARESCEPGVLLIAHAYIAFFFILFIPNTVVVIVAFAELLRSDVVDRTFAQLDAMLFFGQLPVCSFLAKHFLLSPTAPLQRHALAAMLQRNDTLLRAHAHHLEAHLRECRSQLDTTHHMLDQIHRADEDHVDVEPLTVHSGMIRRYTQRLPELTWRTTFVPVFRIHGREETPRLRLRHVPDSDASPRSDSCFRPSMAGGPPTTASLDSAFNNV